MIKIFNYNYNRDTKIITVLNNCYGLGYTKSQKLTEILGLKKSAKLRNFTKREEEKNLINSLKLLEIEHPLRLRTYRHMRKVESLFCYKTVRKLQALPSRGQRTHSMQVPLEG